MTKNQFIGLAINDLVENGITVQFNKRKNNSKNGSNYFDPDKPVLVINYYSDQFDQFLFEVFLHEYSHFIQWKTNKEQWKLYDKSYEIFQDWLDGKRKTCNPNILLAVQELELDCDRIAISLIKKHNLPIKIKSYIKQSNSYILSYNLIYKYRKFFNFSACYHDDILKLMKERQLTKKQLGILPEGYEDIFIKYSE